MSIRNKKLLTALLVVMFSSAPVFADDAAVTGREGQAFGNQLSGSMKLPTESGGMIEFGDESINPSEFAPSGDGFYVQDPNVGGMQGIYDSDHDMDVTGRATQGKLYSDAQAMGNPFDPDPTKRNDPGPSTVSGAAYQIVLGVSGAREKFPDLTNDPIVVGSGQAMVNEDLLESFGDCSVETEVTESTRPVRVPEEEFCERVVVPKGQTCQIRREITLKNRSGQGTVTKSGTGRYYNDGWDWWTQGNISFAEYYHEICGSGEVSLQVTKAKYRTSFGTKEIDPMNSGYTGYPGYGGYSWSWWNGPSGGTYVTLYHPSCGNGLKAAWEVVYGNANTVTTEITISYTKNIIEIDQDNWWPQECVELAQKNAQGK